MGCGRVGASLARSLERIGHDVAVVDQDPAAFRRLGSDFSGRRVAGVGFDRDTLVQAGVEQAYALAAVSSGDNSNILAARVARETFGVGQVVARIYDAKRAAAMDAPPRVLARALLRLVDALLPGCPCEVLLGDAQAGYLEVVGTRGFRANRGLGCRIPLGVGVTGEAARSDRPVFVREVAADPRYIPGVPRAQWELAFPLHTRGRVIGVVDLESPQPRRPSLLLRRYLGTLCRDLAPAFARALPAAQVAPLRLSVLPGRGAGRGSRAAAGGDIAALLAERQLRALYQPVAELQDRRVIGYEAEVRGPQDSPWARPDLLFAAGRDAAEETGLDLARVRAALVDFRVGAGRLFVDVHSASLRRAGFLAGVTSLLREFGLTPQDLVLEVADFGGDHLEALRRVMHEQHAGAFLLAVDRFGSGSGNAQALVELQPAYIKLDAALVRGVDRDFGRRTYIESLCYYTRRTKTQLIAVGVATAGELGALRQCGVAYAQGEIVGPASPLRA